MQSALTAYSSNENLGSPGKVYDLLVEAAKTHPISGNAEGSYLTMRSKEGAIFFVINIVGNFVSNTCSLSYIPTLYPMRWHGALVQASDKYVLQSWHFRRSRYEYLEFLARALTDCWFNGGRLMAQQSIANA